MSEILTQREITAALKKRVQALAPKIKKLKGWKVRFCETPGNEEFNTAKWGMIITNVINGHSTNEKLITALEEFYEANKHEAVSKPKKSKIKLKK